MQRITPMKLSLETKEREPSSTLIIPAKEIQSLKNKNHKAPHSFQTKSHITADLSMGVDPRVLYASE